MNAISHRFTLPKCSTACLPRLPSWWPACPHISCSGFRMNAFGEWAFSGRTLHNQKRLICQVCNIFFPGAFSGMCHRRWGRRNYGERWDTAPWQLLSSLSISPCSRRGLGCRQDSCETGQALPYRLREGRQGVRLLHGRTTALCCRQTNAPLSPLWCPHPSPRPVTMSLYKAKRLPSWD